MNFNSTNAEGGSRIHYRYLKLIKMSRKNSDVLQRKS